MHNLITLHGTTDALVVYGSAFLTGALIASALIYIDRASNGSPLTQRDETRADEST